MLKRMIVMLAATMMIVAALGFVKFKQIQTAVAQGAAFQPPPEAVTTIVAGQEEWPSTLTEIGTVAAVRGVTVSADLPGVVDRIAFESGQPVREGDVLAVLDTRQERAQLAAAEAQRDLAHLNFERMEGLLSQRVISKAEFERATAEQRQSDARVGEIRAAIDRKTIRAPFSGVLGIRRVNLGQYLSAGDALVTLEALNPIYVNFGVPQQAVGQMRVGRGVRVTTDDATESTALISGAKSRRSIRSPTKRRGTFRSRRPSITPRRRCGPACSCRASRPGRKPRRGVAAGLGYQLRAVRRLGLRRGRHHA